MNDQQKSPSRIQLRNRAAIKSAALSVFSQHGFRGSTLDQIADACDMTKPNLLYYYSGKEEIHRALLDDLLENWLDPLKQLQPGGEPIEELLAYVQRKLEMSRTYPEQSRLYANEILRGAPHLLDFITGELKELVEEKVEVIRGWVEDGRIARIDPYHLLFSIWSMTQHYADFEVQVSAILPQGSDPIADASSHLRDMFSAFLSPE